MPLGQTRTVSAGVDVDDLRFYYQIHGLDASAASDAAWTLGVPRFLKLFDETKIQVPSSIANKRYNLDRPA